MVEFVHLTDEGRAADEYVFVPSEFYPIDQVGVGDAAGNCFSACVAMLLGMRSLDGVPAFIGEDWEGRLAAWLRPMGWAPLVMTACPQAPPGTIAAFAGHTVRGTQHSVICVSTGDAWRLLHDPHPSRAGITTFIDAVVLTPAGPELV